MIGTEATPRPSSGKRIAEAVERRTNVPAGAALRDGAVAGLLATVPMSAVMLVGHRLLPDHEQYPLPPTEITAKVAGEGADAVDAPPPPPEAIGPAAVAAHFGFGAAMGAAYRLAVPQPNDPAAGALRGMGWGLAVWAGSYLGLLPAAGILKPATEHPARRNALMIASHLVWGAALGALLASRSPAPGTATACP